MLYLLKDPILDRQTFDILLASDSQLAGIFLEDPSVDKRSRMIDKLLTSWPFGLVDYASV